jgi:K+-sensing histidine kinase KdpD
MLAHELRGPLAPIHNSLELLRRSGPSPESSAGDGVVDVLERQVAQMVRLVDDLLDAARIARGRIELRLEQVELSALVYQAATASTLRSRARRRSSPSRCRRRRYS